MEGVLLVSRIFLLCFLIYYGLWVVCAAITDFYVVFFVEDLVVPVIFRKMFTDEVQELSADVCLFVRSFCRAD